MASLCAVTGLRYGEARERPPIKPVPEEQINAVAPFVTPQVQSMIDLQLWTACRPGEAFLMRAIDINMQGRIWEYRPHSHKVEHHGKERVIYLGPHAQKIITPWLKMDLHAYLFSPREARAWCQARRAANRKTPKPLVPKKAVRKAEPKRTPGDRYTNQAYCHAIRRACEMAFGMPKELRHYPKEIDAAEKDRLTKLAAEWRKAHCWNPHRLRHNAGTRVRAAYGVEMARIILGVSSIPVSQIYAEENREKAMDIMGKIG